MSPAAASSASCLAWPSPVSCWASRKPEAKQTAPPAPHADSCPTTSIVASRLTPTKAASGAFGRLSIPA